jgi:hypothetical protein
VFALGLFLENLVHDRRYRKDKPNAMPDQAANHRKHHATSALYADSGL